MVHKAQVGKGCREDNFSCIGLETQASARGVEVKRFYSVGNTVCNLGIHTVKAPFTEFQSVKRKGRRVPLLQKWLLIRV